MAPERSCFWNSQHPHRLRQRDRAIRASALRFPEGGIVALLGSNGAGKSHWSEANVGILYTEEGVIENGTIRFRNEEVQARAR